MDPFSLYSMARSLDDTLRNTLVKGVCSFGSLDQVLSTCLCLIPESYGPYGMAGQACQTVLGVLRICYDSITQSQTDGQTAKFTWTTVMKLIRQIEVLYEMHARQLAQKGKCDVYNYMAGLELVKLFVRLCKFRSSDLTLITDYPSTPYYTSQVERRRNPDHVLEALRTLSDIKRAPVPPTWASACGVGEFQDPQTPLCAETDEELIVDTDGDSATSGPKLWWDNLQHPTALHRKEPEAREPDVSSLLQFRVGKTMLLMGEMIYIVRPVACILAIRKYGSCSWKPWLISLGMDVCSRALLSKGESLVKYTGVNRSKELSVQDQLLSYLQMARNLQWTPVEKKEMNRRRTLFLVYLFRSPLFEHMTRPGLDASQRFVSSVPLLGSTIATALELLYGVQRYYTYTTGRW